MASRKPSRATNHSRRSFLRNAAMAGTAVTGGLASLPGASAETVGAPTIPDQFDTDAWKPRTLGQENEGGFSWSGIALNNVELAEKVRSEIGYTEPLWRLYSWKLDAPHEDYADGGPSDEGNGGLLPFNVDHVTLGADGGLLSASVQLSNLGDGSDGVETKRGKKALEIYGDQVESDYPFTSVTSCEGLQSSEHLNCFRPTEISYSAPTATVEEKYTVHKEYSKENFELDYRGLFVLQTFDDSETFVVSGAIFPDSKVDQSLSLNDFHFDKNMDKDFVDQSRAFIKSAGSPP